MRLVHHGTQRWPGPCRCCDTGTNHPLKASEWRRPAGQATSYEGSRVLKYNNNNNTRREKRTEKKKRIGTLGVDATGWAGGRERNGMSLALHFVCYGGRAAARKCINRKSHRMTNDWQKLPSINSRQHKSHTFSFPVHSIYFCSRYVGNWPGRAHRPNCTALGGRWTEERKTYLSGRRRRNPYSTSS